MLEEIAPEAEATTPNSLDFGEPSQAAPKRKQPAPRRGVPTWAWVAGGAGVLAVVGVALVGVAIAAAVMLGGGKNKDVPIAQKPDENLAKPAKKLPNTDAGKPDVKPPPIKEVVNPDKEKPDPVPPATFRNRLGMEFARIPKGTAWLGGGGGKPGDKKVEISQDFYLGVYEITQGEWQKAMAGNPSNFKAVAGVSNADQKRFPVEQVSWDDAQLFLAKLNELDKQEGWVYRLPKEIEWEYACRGGPMADKAQSAFDYYFDKPTNQLLPAQANFQRGGGLNRTCKVGSYAANSLGLYDMHGNVWEWCDDSQINRAPLRIMRGGSWTATYEGCTAANRPDRKPDARNADAGLRVARVPVGPVASADGFVPLFNGVDLTGWRPNPDWRVVDGVLTTVKQDAMLLQTVREDYKDFHLRFEARAKKYGSIDFRSGSALLPYRLQFGAPPGRVSLARTVPKGKTSVAEPFGTAANLPSGEWVGVELVAEGNPLQGLAEWNAGDRRRG